MAEHERLYIKILKMVICSKEQFKTDIERGVRAWMLAFTANLMISRNKLILLAKYYGVRFQQRMRKNNNLYKLPLILLVKFSKNNFQNLLTDYDHLD